jgi:hypothetical protein
MAKGKMPFFVAAPRCKITVAGQDIAYAVGLSLQVTKVIEPVRILGNFAPVAFESLMVNPVRGTFQIVRLLSSASDNAAIANALYEDAPNLGKVDADGNSASSHKPAPGVNGAAGTILGQGGLYRHLDPVSIILSQSFDIQIQLKVPQIVGSHFGNELLKSGPYTISTTNFITIKDARLSGARGSLTPASIFRESFTFEGLLAVQSREKQDTSWSESPGGA